MRLFDKNHSSAIGVSIFLVCDSAPVTALVRALFNMALSTQLFLRTNACYKAQLPRMSGTQRA